MCTTRRCKVRAKRAGFKVTGYHKNVSVTPKCSIVNISSLIVHSSIIFTAQLLQYVIVEQCEFYAHISKGC